jgi:hypothetical protein
MARRKGQVKQFNTIKILSGEGRTSVEIDGVRVHALTGIRFEQEVGKPPRLHLDLLAIATSEGRPAVEDQLTTTNPDDMLQQITEINHYLGGRDLRPRLRDSVYPRAL